MPRLRSAPAHRRRHVTLGHTYFAENGAYTYNWDVLHDFQGLIDLMGDPKAAEKKLDEIFTTTISRLKHEFWYKFADSTGLLGQFVMGNEPSFIIPYLYNHVGTPWKTQTMFRELLGFVFRTTSKAFRAMRMAVA